MDVGLVMLVKNEVKSVEAALAPILDQFAEVTVYDTGSTDGTQDLLRERLRIEPLPASLESAVCGNLASLRNRGFARLKTHWRMTLDADERLAPDGFKQLRKVRVPNEVGGYSCVGGISWAMAPCSRITNARCSVRASNISD